MSTKTTIRRILQHSIDQHPHDLRDAVIEAAIEFKYLITDFEISDTSITIYHKDLKFRFRKSDFNYDPLFI